MSSDKKPPPAKATDFGGLYLPGDPIPKPDAVEANSDSAWALFNELKGRQEARYAQTAPGGLTVPGSLASRVANGDQRYAATEPARLAQHPAAPASRPAPKSVAPTVDDAMLEARRNNRVCPLPLQWKLMYELLPARTDANGRREPTPPINTAAAWRSTPSLSKRMCLREQIEWSAANGCLDAVHHFLSSMKEDEWHHMGE